MIMKTMIYSMICAISVICGFTSCSSDDKISGDPAKDWAGTTYFFAPTDAQAFDTYLGCIYQGWC